MKKGLPRRTCPLQMDKESTKLLLRSLIKCSIDRSTTGLPKKPSLVLRQMEIVKMMMNPTGAQTPC